MPTPITPELEALLTDKKLIANKKHRGEIEIDYVIPGFTELGTLQNLALLPDATAYNDATRHTGDPVHVWEHPERAIDGNNTQKTTVGNGLFGFEAFLVIDLGDEYQVEYFKVLQTNGDTFDLPQWSDDGSAWTTMTITETGVRTNPATQGSTWTIDGGAVTARYWSFRAIAVGNHPSWEIAEIQVWGTPTVEVPATRGTAVFKAASISIDSSRKQAAAQIDAVLANPTGELGWYTGDGRTAIPNNPIRAYAWYGPRSNRVCIGTGILDRLAEHRNPKTIALKARSRMKLLLAPHVFVAIGPQGADDKGAIRTEANGVYLGKTIGYIVNDIFDRGGIAAADRVIDDVAFDITIAEYALTDRTSWAEQITGTDRLATAAGCDLWEDPLGKFHFAPSPLLSATSPDADWALAAGVNVMAFDHQVDDENRVTRVEVTGPMTSSIPKWSEVWRTTVLKYPAGLWYDPTDDDNLRAIDRVEKYIYKIRQSDRKILSKAYLGGYPLGLSGDPLDSSHYFVLRAPWRNKGLDAGSATGNKLLEYRKSDNVLLDSHDLPDGRWTAMKTDGTNVWLTSYDDGKLYKRTMAGGAVSSTSITVDGVVQTHPTGLWINGTTIGVFFAGSKRFILVDSSAPGTVTGRQSTKGTWLAGGESNTDTDIDLYGDADAGSNGLTTGLIAKFTLAELVTTDVSAISIDHDLEDALGLQAGVADRIHAGCPNSDDPHPFEIRLATVSMKVVQSLAQAQDVADAQLVLLSRVRRVLDLVVVGNPGSCINDVASYADAIAGVDAPWVIDTKRIALTPAGTYIDSMSVLPWEAP